MIERAKGILMERHAVDERRAFELLRDNARSGGRRVVDVAQTVLDGHALLPQPLKSVARPARQRGLTSPRRASGSSRSTVARDAARLGDQQRAREPVPRVGGGLDPRVEAAGGDPGELERARAGVAQQAGVVEDAVGVVADARLDEAVLAEEGGDVGLRERARRRGRWSARRWRARPSPRAAV